MNLAHSASARGGFTLVELVAVVGVAGLACWLAIAPGLARSRANGAEQACRANLRQLGAAWTLYAADNREAVAQNPLWHEAPGGVGHTNGAAWAFGRLDWGATPDNTNALLVASPKYSKLASYIGGDARLFRCPSDSALSDTQRTLGWTHRIRSYSSPANIGYRGAGAFPSPIYRAVRSMGDFHHPTPSEAMVFLEEHPAFIGDPAFESPDSSAYKDVPASWHAGGMNMAMADGSARGVVWVGGLAAEHSQRLRGPRETPPQVQNDPDARTLRRHTPRLTGEY